VGLRRIAGGPGGRAYEWDETVLLGPGGHGRVHPGTAADGRQVAVKVVRLRTDSTRRWLEEAVLSEREWDVARRLTPSPTHLLPALDAFHDGDDFVLVMPRADGSLKDRLEDGRVLAPHECRNLLRDAATGLQQLHTAGVLHRDVKPGNVLRWQDRWVLGDFGVARIVDAPADGVTWRGTGTPEYWAPEYARTQAATFQTDLYALGCTALEALTGVTPVRGADLETEHRRLLPRGAAAGDPVLDRVLHDLLNKDPARRPRDARQVVESISPPRGLGEAQKGLLRLAAAASRQDAEDSTAASVAEQADQRRDEALRVLDGLWTRLERLVADLGLPVRTHRESGQRHLVLGGARLTVSAFPPAGAGDALLLGRVSVQNDSGAAGSNTCPANVVCSWTDGPLLGTRRLVGRSWRGAGRRRPPRHRSVPPPRPRRAQPAAAGTHVGPSAPDAHRPGRMRAPHRGAASPGARRRDGGPREPSVTPGPLGRLRRRRSDDTEAAGQGRRRRMPAGGPRVDGGPGCSPRRRASGPAEALDAVGAANTRSPATMTRTAARRRRGPPATPHRTAARAAANRESTLSDHTLIARGDQVDKPRRQPPTISAIVARKPGSPYRRAALTARSPASITETRSETRGALQAAVDPFA